MPVRAPEFGSSDFHDAHSSFLEVSRAEGDITEAPTPRRTWFEMQRTPETRPTWARFRLQEVGDFGLWGPKRNTLNPERDRHRGPFLHST